jgi:hypothetical protein
MTEDRGQRSEDRRQKTDVRCQKTDDRRLMSEALRLEPYAFTFNLIPYTSYLHLIALIFQFQDVWFIILFKEFINIYAPSGT